MLNLPSLLLAAALICQPTPGTSPGTSPGTTPGTSPAPAPSPAPGDTGSSPKLPEAPPQAQPAAKPGEPGAAPVAPAAKPAPEILHVDALLDALENADKGIANLQAAVVYDRRNALAGDQQVRFGTLLFESRPGAGGAPPRRGFLVHFNKLFVDAKQQNEDNAFIFDGEWLVEKDAINKMFIKRMIAPPGKQVDPFRIGDAPMIPLPIGQRKADIVQRYKAEMLPPLDILGAEPSYARHVENSYQLLLIPHNWSPREPFREIRLWYQKGTLLPLMSRTINQQGDEYFVQLVNARINQNDFPRERINVEPPPPEAGFNIQIQARPEADPAPADDNAPVIGRGNVTGPAVKP